MLVGTNFAIQSPDGGRLGQALSDEQSGVAADIVFALSFDGPLDDRGSMRPGYGETCGAGDAMTDLLNVLNRVPSSRFYFSTPDGAWLGSKGAINALGSCNSCLFCKTQ